MSDSFPPGPPQFPTSPPLAPPPSPVPPGALPPSLWAAPPPAPAPEPGRRVPPWVVVVAVLAVVALVGGVVLASTGGDDDGDDERATAPFEREETTTTEGPDTTEAPPDDEETTPTTEASPEDLDAVIADIEAFVAEERGLPFLREVTVTLLDDDAFEERLFEGFEEDSADIVTSGQVLQAIGLVEPGTDMVEAVRSLLGGGVVGTYDPETDELLVRGTDVSPYVRTVIAHELTHALDDQHFELNRPELDDAADESGFGFTALVEGNASRVEEAYRATFTDAEEAEASAEELTIGGDTDIFALPLALIESLYAPYLLGPQLVGAILDDGGQVRLDAAFTSPPTTSEALLDPGTYLEGQTSLPVPAPVADGAEIDRGVLGALGLGQLLGETGIIFGGGLGDATEGWGGDQYVAWVQGDQVCLRANIVGDTSGDTAEIADALDDWAAAPPFEVVATVEATPDLVTLTSCG